MTFRPGILALAALALPQASLAEGPTPEAQAALDTCVEKAGMVDLDIKDCYNEFAGREDERLNKAWRELIRIVGGVQSDEGAALLAEQRAWLGFRDQSCFHWIAATYPGTLDLLSFAICYAEVVTRRADDIEILRDTYQGISGESAE